MIDKRTDDLLQTSLEELEVVTGGLVLAHEEPHAGASGPGIDCNLIQFPGKIFLLCWPTR